VVIVFALIGALTVGVLLGLAYKGFVMFGDRRQLDILSEHLQTEHRMSQATTQAIAQMRRIVRDNLGRNRS
jgi:hypothetical protein